VSQAATAGLLAVAARRSSAREFGVFVIVYSLSLFVGGVLDFGSSQLATRELSKDRRSVIGSRSWLLRRTAFQAFPALIFAGGVGALFEGIPRMTFFGVALQAWAFTFTTGILAQVRARRGAHIALWLVACGNVAALVFLLPTSGSHIWQAVAIAVPSSWLIAAGGATVLLLHDGKRGGAQTIRNPWAGSMSLGVHAITIQVFGLNIVAVGWLAGADEAARLGAVSRWTQPIAVLASASAQAGFPAFASAPDGRSAVRRLADTTDALWFGAAIALGLILAGPLAIELLIGDAFSSSASLLRLLTLSAIPVLISQPLAGLLQARHDDRFVARSAMIATASGMAAVVALTAPLGAYSVGLAVTYGFRARRLWFKEDIRFAS